MFTSSWLPADDKLFPQCHLSDESSIKFWDSIGAKESVRPAEIRHTEIQVQSFTARGMSVVQTLGRVGDILHQISRATYVASLNTRFYATLESQDSITNTLKRVSQVIGNSMGKACPPVNTNGATQVGAGVGDTCAKVTSGQGTVNAPRVL